MISPQLQTSNFQTFISFHRSFVPSCCRACGYLAAYCLLISTHNSRQTCQTSNIQTSQLPAPDGHDYDGQPAIPLVRPDYITEVKRWRVEGIDDNGELILREDPQGPIFKALQAKQEVATEEFWRAIKNASRPLK